VILTQYLPILPQWTHTTIAAVATNLRPFLREQQTSADNRVLTHSNQERMAQFYTPQHTVPQPPYITSSFPQNAACSTYFMPPYQTALVQRAMSPYNLLITFINPQLLIPGIWQIALKPHQAEKLVIVARSSAS